MKRSILRTNQKANTLSTIGCKVILYQDTIENFQKDVLQNAIADRAAESYRVYYNRNPGDPEYRSWQYSLAILNNSFQYAQLKNNHIIIEYELPYASLRIDVLLFGKDVEDNDNVVVLELKQWSNENVAASETEGNVIVNYGRFKGEYPHPSLQVQGYYFHLRDFIKIFSEKNAPQLSASVYAHNYSKKSQQFYYQTASGRSLKNFLYLLKRIQLS